MESIQGNLVIVDINTIAPKIYWKGHLVENVIKIHARNDDDDADLKIVASQSNAVLQDMIAAGLTIKIRGVV